MSELEDLRAKVAAVEALADEWDRFTDADWFDFTPREHAAVLRSIVSQRTEWDDRTTDERAHSGKDAETMRAMAEAHRLLDKAALASVGRTEPAPRV